MKSFMLFCALAVSVAAAQPTGASDPVLPPNVNKAIVEENLLIGLASGNLGLQRSAALMLGKIKSDRAVIPLMAVLHNSDQESLRIAAAYALCRIGDARGTFAVRRAVKFDDCCKVQNTCAWYYETMVSPGTFAFVGLNTTPVDIAALAEPMLEAAP